MKNSLKNIIFNFYVKFKLRFKFNLLIHIFYHFIFSTKIVKIPHQFIYNLELFPATMGDFVHVISIAQALSLKFHKSSLERVIFFYDIDDRWHLFFIKNIAKPIIYLLDKKIKITTYSYSFSKKKSIGSSIFPYIPTFYNLGYKFRNYKSLDPLVIAKLLDLRVFNKISLSEFKKEKYKTIYPKLVDLNKKQFYCFVFRESKPVYFGSDKKFYCGKEWEPNNAIEIINKLINEGNHVVLINPLKQKYIIPGVDVIDIASYDPLVRYFLYIKAFKVISVECGPASMLYHSRFTKYLIYNTDIYFNATKKMLEKELFYKSCDWVFDCPNRQTKFGNIQITDI